MRSLSGYGRRQAALQNLTLVGYSNNFLNGRRLLEVDVEAFSSRESKMGYPRNPLARGSSGAPWLSLSTVYSLSTHFSRQREGVMLGPRFTR